MSEIFNSKGMMRIPDIGHTAEASHEKLVALELYCPNGHNLITERAMFGTTPGALLKVKQGDKSGIIAFSTVCNDLSHITLDIDIDINKPIELFCPECDAELPTHSQCTCGGNIIAYFRTPECNESEALGICNILKCKNAHIIESGQLIQIERVDQIYHM